MKKKSNINEMPLILSPIRNRGAEAAERIKSKRGPMRKVKQLGKEVANFAMGEETTVNENLRTAIDNIAAGSNSDDARELIQREIGAKIIDILGDKKVQLAQAVFSGVEDEETE